MSYSTVTSTWLQRDPEGYVDGPDMYQAFGSNPITNRDPNGTQLFYDKTPGENKTGTIQIYGLYRYVAGADFQANIEDVAKQLKEILEKEFNSHNYKWTDSAGVVWTVQFKAIIITDKALSAKDCNLSEPLEFGTAADEAKYQIYKSKGAFSEVTVHDPATMVNSKEDHAAHPNSMPSTWSDPKYLATLLMHELIGHDLNNEDEYDPKKYAANSIMQSPQGDSFEQRHFDAGFVGTSNIGGPKINLQFGQTHQLVKDDPFMQNWLGTDTDKMRQSFIDQVKALGK
jgi:hypothetical protein